MVESSKNRAALKVAWFSYFPIEWLPDLPPELQNLPKLHPATWQRVLWEEFRQRDDLDLDIIVVRNHFPRSMTFERGGTRFHCVRTPPGARAASLYWLDTFLIARKLRKIRPDLVHAWGTEFAGAAVAGRLNYPALVTMQGILTWYGSVFPLNRHQRISRFLEPGSLRRARVATVESSFGMRYLGEHYPRLKLLQVEHAPSSLFSEVVRAPQSSPPRLVCVGSFLEWKGADIVLKALDGISEPFELLWIGSKNEALEGTLRGQTRPELWAKVTFKHNLSPAEIARELGVATIFVHAARADNSPNSVKEAVVAGVPVIATRTGGIPDYVKPGRNGLLFGSGDVQDCRTQIQAALKHPLFSKGAVDSAALAEMRDYLSARTMASKFRAAYDEALNSYRGLRARTANSTT
jgi:glycosyltransferase involved in cell wall biosynthesis